MLLSYSIYHLCGTIDLLNKNEGTTAPYLYVPILQIVISLLVICSEFIKIRLLKTKDAHGSSI